MKHDEVTLNTSCLICSRPYNAKYLFLRHGVCDKCYKEAASYRTFKSVRGLSHRGRFEIHWPPRGSGYTWCGKDFSLTSRDWDLETGYGERWFLTWLHSDEKVTCSVCRRQHLKLGQVAAYVKDPIKMDCENCLFIDKPCSFRGCELFLPKNWHKMIYIGGKWYEDKLGGQS